LLNGREEKKRKKLCLRSELLTYGPWDWVEGGKDLDIEVVTLNLRTLQQKKATVLLLFRAQSPEEQLSGENSGFLLAGGGAGGSSSSSSITL
jgi:hypothetical protein